MFPRFLGGIDSLGAVSLSRLADAFLLAAVGALAVAFAGAAIGFVKRRAALDRRIGDLEDRVERLEDGRGDLT